MPSFAPFLPHGGILRAPARRRKIIPGGAYVTSNALADIFRPALFDLVG